jgi:hypothetical protein
VDRLKAICTRERITQQEFVERLIMGYAAQPGTAAADSGGDSIDRLSGSVAGLSAEITQLGGSVRDYVETSDDRLSEIEARLSAVEATINSTPVMPIPVPQTSPETPVQPVPGGNKPAGKKPYARKRPYTRASDADREKRDTLFIELHNKGMTPAEISKVVKGEGFDIGTRPSNIHDYLKEQNLIPHSSRK